MGEMDEDEGRGKYPTNKAGAAYGTGYCDAQCPHDMKWINGEANSLEWQPADNDANSGMGHFGTCCVEMDIWESNSVATAYTPHTCDTVGNVRCEGTPCGDNASGERYDGVCDKDGCDFNSWRLGRSDLLWAWKQLQGEHREADDRGDAVHHGRRDGQRTARRDPASLRPGRRGHRELSSQCSWHGQCRLHHGRVLLPDQGSLWRH